MSATERVSPADIRAKLNEIDGSLQETKEAAAPVGIAVGAGAIVVLLVVAFLLGRRRGKRRQTIVEIRRI